MSELVAAFDVLDALRDSGLSTVEVYCKQGRGRSYRREIGSHSTQTRRELGWAVRAGDARCSFFSAGIGRPTPDLEWPTPDGYALVLPELRVPPTWTRPEGLDAPLVGEVEARELVAGVERALAAELSGSRIESARLDDGSSESLLISSTGIEVEWRQRLARLRLEASWKGAQVTLEGAARAVGLFEPLRLAQQLIDRLVVRVQGRVPAKDRCEMVLGPAVSAQLLASLLPLFVGPSASERCRGLVDRRGVLASSQLTIVDDGRLVGGLLASPVDGEGVPTGRRVLLQDGTAGPPLGDWRDDPAGLGLGSMQRPGWRDLPSVGPSHLYIEPPPEAPRVADLVAAVARGYYLVEAPSPASVDWQAGRFALPVSGFSLEAGRAVQPVAGAYLHGAIGAFLRGINAIGRDLAFLPLGGLLGAPTLVVGGLELRSSG